MWIAGFLVMIAAFLLQFLALHFGRLTTVQPILTLELPFLVAILGIWFRLPLDLEGVGRGQCRRRRAGRLPGAVGPERGQRDPRPRGLGASCRSP